VRFNFVHDIGLCKGLDQAVYVSHGNGVQVYDNGSLRALEPNRLITRF
jgi:hypothetical protein